MALLLRKVTPAKWKLPDWCPRGEVPSDALVDIRTTDNTLSFWVVASDNFEDLKMAVTAIVSGQKHLDKLDYALLDEACLPRISVSVDRTSEGRSPCRAANASHCDLTELTAQKSLLLAGEIMQLERKRIPESKVRRLLQEALQSGSLDRNLIDPGLLATIDATPV